MSRVKIWVAAERKPRWFSLLAISMSSSAAKSRRIWSSALGGTIRSAWWQPTPASGTSIRASRCPLVATIRIRSARSSQSTPLRIGRLSSVLAAKATCEMSFWSSPAFDFQLASNLTGGKGRELVPGQAQELELATCRTRSRRAARPSRTPESPALGSSRTISASFLAGRVMAPSWSTEAGTVVDTAMSRSVPERRRPSLRPRPACWRAPEAWSWSALLPRRPEAFLQIALA